MPEVEAVNPRLICPSFQLVHHCLGASYYLGPAMGVLVYLIQVQLSHPRRSLGISTHIMPPSNKNSAIVDFVQAFPSLPGTVAAQR